MVEDGSNSAAGKTAPLSPDRSAEAPSPRAMRKWPIIAAFWAAQAALVFFFFPFLAAITTGRWSDFFSFTHDGQYLIIVSIYVPIVTIFQAAFVAPISRPEPARDPRPSFWRIAACGTAMGVLAMLLLLFGQLALLTFGVEAVQTESSEELVLFPAAAIVVGAIATLIFRRRFKDGIPVKISLLFVIILSGLLVMSILAVLFDAAELVLIHSNAPVDSLPNWAWITLWIGVPILTWTIFTPLILAFARRGHPDRQLSRLANRLFLGTLIEAIVTIPIDAMVRRKTSCYCGEGTFWALIICGSVGLITLGPAIYLLPIGRRRQRLIEGRCPACGYDMSGSPKADRCPECGAGWKPAPPA